MWPHWEGVSFFDNRLVAKGYLMQEEVYLTPDTPLIRLWCAQSKLNMDEICSLNIHLWYVDVVVRIRNQSLYIRTAIISVIIYNDRYFWFLYIMANFFQSVYIMQNWIISVIIYNSKISSSFMKPWLAII